MWRISNHGHIVPLMVAETDWHVVAATASWRVGDARVSCQPERQVFKPWMFRTAQEVRRVWVGYLSQCDSSLGQKVAAKLQSNGAL